MKGKAVSCSALLSAPLAMHTLSARGSRGAGGHLVRCDGSARPRRKSWPGLREVVNRPELRRHEPMRLTGAPGHI